MSQIASLDSRSFSRLVALQQAPTCVAQADLTQPAMYEQPQPLFTTATELSAAAGPCFFGVVNGAIQQVDRSEAVFAARVIRRNFAVALAVLAYSDGLLVNGIGALEFSVLDIKSTLVVPGIDAIFYVTEKIKPYVGPPPEDVLGRECPICKIPFDPQTRVGGCRCGQFFHFETPESHPDVPNEDRLDCFQRAGVCHCRATLTTEEQLTWSPEEL